MFFVEYVLSENLSDRFFFPIFFQQSRLCEDELSFKPLYNFKRFLLLEIFEIFARTVTFTKYIQCVQWFIREKQLVYIEVIEQ